MKPLQLTRLMICGLAASTFFLVNCSNTTPRSVRAKMNNKQDVIQHSFVTCSPKALELLSQRRDLQNQMSQIIGIFENGSGELDSSQKAKIQNQIEELATLSNSIVNEIKSGKSESNKSPTGCLQDITDTDKKIQHTIPDIRAMDLKFAKKVQKITKKTNSIIEGESKRDLNRDQNPQDENSVPNNGDDSKNNSGSPDQNKDNREGSSGQNSDANKYGKFSEGRELNIDETLAELLKSPNLIKESVIVSGEIDISDAAKRMIENPAQDGLNSFCFIEGTTGAYSKGDKLKVAAIREKKIEKASLVKIALVGNSEQLAGIACRLNVESNFEAEISKVFTNLL